MNLIDGPSIILLLKQKKTYNYYPSYPFSNMWKSWPLFLEIPSVCPFLAHGYCLNLKPLFISLDFYRNVLQNLHFLVFCIQISESFLKLNFIISLSCWKSIKGFSTTYRVQVKYYTKKNYFAIWTTSVISAASLKTLLWVPMLKPYSTMFDSQRHEAA